MSVAGDIAIRSVTQRQGGAEPEDQVTEKFLGAARRQGLPAPLTGYRDPRLRDPHQLLQEGWTISAGSNRQVYLFQVGTDDEARTIQSYSRLANAASPEERLMTYIWRGRHFYAEILLREASGKVVRFYQGS